jgi:hypothetical protein
MWCYTKDVGMSIYPLKVSEGDDIKNNGKVLIYIYIYIYKSIYGMSNKGCLIDSYIGKWLSNSSWS